MKSTLTPNSTHWHPMLIIDQYGSAAAHAWFPPGTPTEPTHILPGPVYAEVCRRAGVEPNSPWVAFKSRAEALTAMTGAWLTVTVRAAGVPI
jgi:hypothetical protein